MHRLVSLAAPAQLFRRYAATGNLPRTFAPLVGRESELSGIGRLLTEAEKRCVTIVGPPGVGKTRLAVEVAQELLPELSDGAYFVPLAPLASRDLIVPRIAQALGLMERVEQPLVETVKTYLRQRDCLLLLDNFEHLLPAQPFLTDLLASAPRLRIVVTSRSPLHLDGEQEFPLLPLPLPEERKTLTIKGALSSPAVQLFMRQAALVRPDFALTAQNMAAIVEICRKLDGLPLAIEIAAAKAKVLSPRDMLARLGDVISGLGSDHADGHSSLRASIEWSYNLLPAGAGRLFRALSVFRGGCSLEAIEWVLSDSIAHEPPVEAPVESADATRLLDDIARLVDHSLLAYHEEGGHSRYSMLETISEFAEEELMKSGEAVQRSHARYYRHLAQEANGGIHGPRQLEWLDMLEMEQDNFQAAIDWTVRSRKVEEALMITSSLAWFWFVRGYWREGSRFLQSVLELTEQQHLVPTSAPLVGAPANMLADALACIGLLYVAQMEFGAAEAVLDRSMSLREYGDEPHNAFALTVTGILYRMQMCYSRARPIIEKAVALAEAAGNTWLEAFSLQKLGTVLGALDEPEGERETLEKSLVLHKRLGNKQGIATCASDLGEAARRRGDFVAARAYYEEAIHIGEEIRDASLLAVARANEGYVLYRLGEYSQADMLFKASLTIAWPQLPGTGRLALYIIGLAGASTGLGNPARGARLLGTVSSTLGNRHETLDAIDGLDYEHIAAATSAGLDGRSFQAAWNAGLRMSLEEAVSYALAEFAAEPSLPAATAVSVLAALEPPLLRGGHGDHGEQMFHLTKREAEVLRLVTEGMSNARIAAILSLSSHTVANHIYSIYSKIGVVSRAAAVRFAIDHELV